MFTVNGKDVVISKGDTGKITVTFTGEVPENGTVALVTLRESVNKCEAVWEKRVAVHDGVIVIDLSSEDTDIPFFSYVWDIRLIYENGDIYSPFPPAKFTVCEVVGDV